MHACVIIIAGFWQILRKYKKDDAENNLIVTLL